MFVAVMKRKIILVMNEAMETGQIKSLFLRLVVDIPNLETILKAHSPMVVVGAASK